MVDPRAPGRPLRVIQPARPFVPFFQASLGLALVLGTPLGVLGLARLTGPWGPLHRPSVWLHGYVQVFGFVALFVMGFAYHAVPRFLEAPSPPPRLVRASLHLMLAGLAAVSLGFLYGSHPWQPLWIAGTGAITGAAFLFVWAMGATLRARTVPRRPFEPWFLAGAAWLALAALMAFAAAVAGDATWHHVLWPAALYGFAASWIFGVGRRMLPLALGWTVRWPRLEGPAFWLYQLGVAAWSMGAWPEEGLRAARGAGAVALLSGTLLHAAAVGVLGRHRPPASARDRDYERYVDAAWAWLAVALAIGPGWTLGALARGDYGSMTVLDFARHALALGFVTQMILGVGGRFVPAFVGASLWSPRAHRAAFWLLNLSVALRGLELVVASGLWSGAWSLVALAGPPAGAAVLLFALNMFVVLRPGRRSRYLRSSIARRPLQELLQAPGALDVLVAAGLSPLRSRAVRVLASRTLTLEQACRLMRVPLDPVLSRLAGIGAPRSRPARDDGAVT